ncbi:MAG: DNA starvation/stationary phase protection protein [Bacilli bacterium]|nr:DNA starvation/stationary phase protection protein [Bacilli bacterium]MDD4077938.1 DNA starvation/stationary phase protection protein [Bacilli bacterium]
MKFYNYHWLVTGEHFYKHHEIFEKFYNEATEYFDAIAERILMLGEKPYATLKEFLDNTIIKEATGNETAKEILETIIEDFKLLNDEFYKVIKEAQDLSDEVTVDLVLGILSSLQKHIWMLKATLG